MPAVHGVAGKAADRFCDNQVNLAVQRICDHLLKALALFGAGASDAFVGIHVDKLPIVAALYVLLLGDVRENGTTQNYLIQHSAGSGKINSIAWLAHRLTSLHDVNNKIIFDNVIIVMDRVVVDRLPQKATMGMSILGFKLYQEWNKEQFEDFIEAYGFSVVEMKFVYGGLAPIGVMIARRSF